MAKPHPFTGTTLHVGFLISMAMGVSMSKSIELRAVITGVCVMCRRVASTDEPSGFGFELTFRLHCSDSESPPAWPAELLQSLAGYVFSSGNLLCVGDHISWHSPLDKQESRIQHMLLAPDPQLLPAKSALGHIHFLQIVGVTAEEVSAAQAWNGMGILKLMKASSV